MSNPDDKLLVEVLNSWPEGTKGYQQDAVLIRILNDLCRRFGYGRTAQVAGAIEEIWREPVAAVEKWKAFKKGNL